MDKHIAIIGASGMLGHALRDRFTQSFLFDSTVLDPSINKIDITNRDNIEDVLGIPLDYVINAAAYTDVDGAEGEGRETSRKVNVEGVYNLAELARKKGFKLIQYSTAFVFDGKKGNYDEEDPPSPLGEYAKHKLEAEGFVLAEHGLVLRADQLYGKYGKNFVNMIRELASNIEKFRIKDGLEVVYDQTGSPTNVKDLAEMTEFLINADAEGIYHAVNKGSCSRSDLTRMIIELLGLKCDVHEISTEEYNRRNRSQKVTAIRPENCSLNVDKLSKIYSLMPEQRPIKTWEEALKAHLKI